ncbi:hypothetical protein CANARDRAFT_71276 [[Candida] arabinofermentans NRRL YB-2248]|uniref:Dystroglycan-type cadherin-like domain-containing protein n=1 Tax=[Candida] arabinofermentans NRRL YB-2248 TaxID=983967 RepID=A0A1E4SX90_9ASCO|nr:hypothetical protein CANARDRAFT_71276 [[Candida] arabinofermentans NRRL YB-2248]
MKIHSLSNLLIAVSHSLLYLRPALADVQEGFPFSQQLPDVARVGEAYSFTINKETYESTDSSSSVTYSVENLPSWLSFDSSSLTFSGTPETDDATDKLEFQLIGKDGSGSNLNDTVSIVVSADPGPQLKSSNSIVDQISAMGSTDGSNGLIVSPNTEFTIKFDSDTFELLSGSSGSIVDYYGKSLNRTSLPSWCYFDSDTLTFSGTAPTINSDIAPSQEFGFILIATDYAGYTGAYGSFYIVVGAHELSSNLTGAVVVNGTAGESITIDIPLKDVLLDGSSISSSDIASVDLYEAPSWISISDDDVLTGTIPDSQDDNLLLNVTVSDVYGNSVYLDFEIDLLTEIFSVDSLPDVNATRGKWFSYTLPDSDFSDLNDTTIKASYTGADWLTYYYTNHTFTGTAPYSLNSVEVTVKGTMNSISDEKSFKIKGVGVHSMSSSHHSSMSSTISSSYSSRTSSHHVTSSSSHSSSHSSSSVTSSASSSATPLVAGKSSKSNSKALAIGLGVALPLLALIVAAILFFFCCWKRRKSNKDDDGEDEKPKTMYMNPTGTNETLKNDDYDYQSDLEGGAYDADAKRLSALNVLKLNEAGLSNNRDDSSSLTDVGSVYGDNGDNNKSSAELLGGAAGAKVTKSWRGSNANPWKPRDSLSSLATVATTDLLTVRVTDDPNKVRKSQSNFFHGSSSNNASKDGILNYQAAGKGTAAAGGSKLNITRDFSDSSVATVDSMTDSSKSLDPRSRMPGPGTISNSGSVPAKLVEFTNKGTTMSNDEDKYAHGEQKSFEGVIEDGSSRSFMI